EIIIRNNRLIAILFQFLQPLLHHLRLLHHHLLHYVGTTCISTTMLASAPRLAPSTRLLLVSSPRQYNLSSNPVAPCSTSQIYLQNAGFSSIQMRKLVCFEGLSQASSFETGPLRTLRN